jgi:hypothetical protein
LFLVNGFCVGWVSATTQREHQRVVLGAYQCDVESQIIRQSTSIITSPKYLLLHRFSLPPFVSAVPLAIKNLQTPLRSRHNIHRLDTHPIFLTQHKRRGLRNVVCDQRLKTLHKLVVPGLIEADTD